MATIETTNIAGLRVYGQQQVDYTLEGVEHRDFAAAVAFASIQRAVAIEVMTGAVADAVRMRERKLTDLGQVLAYVAEAGAKFTSKSKVDDTVATSGLAEAKDILTQYGLTGAAGYISISGSNGKVKNGEVSKLQTDVQYAADREDNQLQQDLVALQGYFAKRDQSYSLAAKLVKKVNASLSAGIRNIQ
ncbi:MAG: hypothetical protein J6Z49_01325 [Kiritimatiellae bacterium]|nr:hypothetical protein [Kiritimatiellia bacterium]